MKSYGGKNNMHFSLIATVKNEEKSIQKFLDSIKNQTKKPDEVVIVDGGSADNTVQEIKKYTSRIKNLKVITKKGNRSVGRNEAIKNSVHDIIACTDAGNILDPDWIKNIIQPFQKQGADVVAGYYKGKVASTFQKCVIPYVLVMPDRLHADSFLPATRSMAFKKSIWQKAGKFSEKYSHNEDYIFAKKLRKMGAKIIFKKNAFVYWEPRENISQFYTMCKRFAYGDSEAGIYRPKVVFILGRYLIALLILSYIFLTGLYSLIFPVFILFLLYVIWAILKNYTYIKHWKAFIFLPILQLTSDIAVIIGTIGGVIERLRKR